MGYKPTFLNTRKPREAWTTVREQYLKSGYRLTRTAEALRVSRSALMMWFKKNPTYKAQLKDLVKKELEI